MGLIIDQEEIGGKFLALEIRRESIVIMDLERKYPHELPAEERREGGPKGKSEHVFCYQEGEIEVSKEFLLELLTYFDDPKHREAAFGDYKTLA